MDFTKINRVAVFKNAKKDLPFKKIGNIEQGEIYKVNGIFPYTSKFGKQYFLSLQRYGENDDCFNFNLPKDQSENAELLLRNEEAIRAINTGECGVAIRQYYSKKYEKQCTSIEWVNIQ